MRGTLICPAIHIYKKLQQKRNKIVTRPSVRQGDIYGFVIEHFAKNNNFKEALAQIQQLRSAIPNVNLAYYVNTDVLQGIEKKMGITLQVDTDKDHAGEDPDE